VAGEDVVDARTGSVSHTVAHVAPHSNQSGETWVFSEARVLKQNVLLEENLRELSVVASSKKGQRCGTSIEVVCSLVLSKLSENIVFLGVLPVSAVGESEALSEVLDGVHVEALSSRVG